MKHKNIVATLLLAGSVLFSACDKVGSSSSVSLKNAKDSAGYAYGMMMGKGMKAEGVDTTLNIELMQKAFTSAVKGDTANMKMQDMEARMFLQTYFGALQAKQQAAQMKKIESENSTKFKGNKEAGEKFLAENKTKAGVQVTASGLQYQVVKEGTGSVPAATDEVDVHYTGTLLNGTKFDSSVDRGKPATFPVNGVIKGWTEALLLMKEGSKYKLFIPYDLAYGAMGNQGIEPYSTLVFDVELIKVNKK